MQKTDSDKREIEYISLVIVSTVITLVMVVSSAFIHELGHAIGLSLLGIPFTFALEILDVGPVLMTKWKYPPAIILDLAFVIAAGPGFAAVVFAILGRFWRKECYVAAVFQACYTPFELLTWVFGFPSSNLLLMLPLFFAIVPVPVMIITYKIFNRIERRKKQ